MLIGPSGCGKSTLLRLLIGLIEPDQGEVRFQGEPITPQNVMLVRRKIGYVIQDGGLFPHLSARDNVGLLAKYLGWTQIALTQRIDELAGSRDCHASRSTAIRRSFPAVSGSDWESCGP